MPSGRLGGVARARGSVAATGLAIALAVLLGVAPPVGAAPYPPLPISLDRDFVGNLTGPTLAPGASGALTSPGHYRRSCEHFPALNLLVTIPW